MKDKESAHFSIPQMPDFIDDTVEMVLTEESKDYFARGRPKQGFVGIVELCPETITANGKKLAKIHLIPADNKESGALTGIDKEGKKMPTTLSMQRLGAFTGDLHLRAAGGLKLGEKAGQNGMLMGFGIWKSGCGIKFLDYLPPREALIKNEYLLIKENDKWQLYFTEVDLMRGEFHPKAKLRSIEKISGLQEALDKLPKNKKLYELNYHERLEIETLLRATEEGKIEKEEQISVVKNRSSSQNAYSINRESRNAQLYKQYFAMEVKFHGAHLAQFPRELPLPVFEKIIKNTAEQLPGVAAVSSVLGLVTGDINGPLLHLEAEDKWIRMTQEERESYVLARAIKLNKTEIIEYLIKDLKIDPNKPIFEVVARPNGDFMLGENLFTPLQYALKMGKDDAVDVLIKNGANNKVSPFMAAIKNNEFETCLKLIDSGEDINTSDENGETILHRAIDKEDYELCKILIEKGANLNAQNHYGETPLLLAARKNNIQLCSMLINKGCDITIQNRVGATLPHIIAEIGNTDFFSKLINMGVDFNVKDKFGKTPYLLAMGNKHFDICLNLIEAGVDINTQDQYGNTLLNLACSSANSDEVCKQLIQKNADLNLKDYSGRTPLEEAIRKENIKVCLMLINNGADLTIENQIYGTVLNYAANILKNDDRIEVCKALIKNGANVNDENFQKFINKDKNRAFKSALENALKEIKKEEQTEVPRKEPLVFVQKSFPPRPEFDPPSPPLEPYDIPPLPPYAPPPIPGQEIKKSDENEADDFPPLPEYDPPSPPRSK